MRIHVGLSLSSPGGTRYLWRHEDLDLERRWAKLRRYLHTAENVVLEANLARVAKPEIQERYRQLMTLEHGVLNHRAGTKAIASTAAAPGPK